MPPGVSCWREGRCRLYVNRFAVKNKHILTVVFIAFVGVQIGDLQVQLFPFLKEEELSVFTCGHVIPPQNLQTLVIGQGPRGGELVFKYDQRENQSMVGILTHHALFSVLSS